MVVWRLTRASHAALDGEGARLYGGRWNSEGVAVVYAASHLTLCALEYLVRVDIADVPDDLIALAIDVPDDVRAAELGPGDLPDGWRETPPSPACAEIGDRWALGSEALLLRVPSVIVPEESNVLVNPRHPRAGEVRVDRVRPFAYDPRLMRRG